MLIAQRDLAKVLAFIRVVRSSVKAASRTAVLENVRELFKTFLSMFDFAAQLGDSEVGVIGGVLRDCSCLIES